MSLLPWPDAVDSALSFKFPAEDESGWLSTIETLLQGTGSLLGRTVARIILSKVSTRASTHWQQFHSKGFLSSVGDLDFACSGVDSVPVRDRFGCADGDVELSKHSGQLATVQELVESGMTWVLCLVRRKG